MAILSNGLYSKLSTTSNISSIVGTRIYPQYQRIADKSYPAIVYKIDDHTTFQTYDGTGANQLVNDVIRLACIGATQTDADNLAAQVLTLDGTSGNWGTVTVQGCFLTDDGVQDDVVTNQVTEEILAYIKEISFQVWWVNS